jgi:DNA helicase II / ATP-dependent DNA helicase PcrA
MDFLGSLNVAQRQAAEATEGPVIVLAGAGSGKTKTLIARMAYLIHKGVRPNAILAVTFTNKAAGEMKHRVEQSLRALQPHWQGRWAQPWTGFSSEAPEVSTFHSFCVKVLRTESHALGLSRPFVIYDDEDTLSLLKQILERQGVEGKQAKRFKSAIDELKCRAEGPDEVNPQDYFGTFGDQLSRVYRTYQSELRQAQAFDFGDLIVEVVKLFQKRADILQRYQDQFRYLMVDEYQDTNRAQYLLVSLLARGAGNICVVGDEDQSIYRWRGADIRNILDFRKEYPQALMIKLEQNYRSTKSIINAASAVIQHNTSRYDKVLWTENANGEKVRWVQLPDERAEAEFVSQEIKHWLRKNPQRTFQDVAVFYRSHAQSRALEEQFRRLRIGYRIVGGVGFYERKEIKDVIAYLRVLVNPDDSISLLRIINTPTRGLGKSSLEKIADYAAQEGISFYNGIRKILADGVDVVPSSARKKLAEFVKLLDSLRALSERSGVGEVYHYLLEASGYVAELKTENTDEAKGRIQNLEEFDTVVQFFEEDANRRELPKNVNRLQGFLNQITIEASLLDNQGQQEGGSVSLMTLHSSKGLEFPLVFLVGCEEGIFPSRQATEEGQDGIEEERRLCYVGMTRARENLLLTSAQIRRIYGQVQVAAPSRFIDEIPKELLQVEVQRAEPREFGVRARWENQRSETWTKRTAGDSRSYDYGEFGDEDSRARTKVALNSVAAADGREVKVGQSVRHAEYGAGTVKLLEGGEQDRKITIEFPGVGKKKFSLKHVQLEF